MRKYKRIFETCPGIKIHEAVILPIDYLKILQNTFIKNRKLIIDSSISNDLFITLLNTLYRDNRIYFIDSEKIEKGIICFKAKYEPKDNNIFLYLASDAYIYLKINFNVVWNSIANMLGHEIVHQAQYIRQKIKHDFVEYDKNKLVKYYSDKKEIMSFAWQAIFLYMCFGRTKSQIINAIKNKDANINEYNNIVLQYYNLFEKGSLQLKLFLKYCYLYLDAMLK